MYRWAVGPATRTGGWTCWLQTQTYLYPWLPALHPLLHTPLSHKKNTSKHPMCFHRADKLSHALGGKDRTAHPGSRSRFRGLAFCNARLKTLSHHGDTGIGDRVPVPSCPTTLPSANSGSLPPLSTGSQDLIPEARPTVPRKTKPAKAAEAARSFVTYAHGQPKLPRGNLLSGTTMTSPPQSRQLNAGLPHVHLKDQSKEEARQYNSECPRAALHTPVSLRAVPQSTKTQFCRSRHTLLWGTSFTGACDTVHADSPSPRGSTYHAGDTSSFLGRLVVPQALWVPSLCGDLPEGPVVTSWWSCKHQFQRAQPTPASADLQPRYQPYGTSSILTPRLPTYEPH